MFVETKRDGESITPPQEPWRDLMLKAADLIDRYGLAKGHLVDEQGQMCVRGALLVAGGATPLRGGGLLGCRTCDQYSEADHHFCRYVIDQLGLFSYDPFNASALWNNHPDRTKAEVVTELRRCATAA